MARPSGFLGDERGATAIEYGLIAAILDIVIIAAFPLVQPGLNTALEAVSNRMVSIASELD